MWLSVVVEMTKGYVLMPWVTIKTGFEGFPEGTSGSQGCLKVKENPTRLMRLAARLVEPENTHAVTRFACS